jgi:hypothetical protein
MINLLPSFAVTMDGGAEKASKGRVKKNPFPGETP